MFDKMQLSSYATEYIIGDYGIWMRYDPRKDIHHWGNPCPEAKMEPMYGISPTDPVFHSTLFKDQKWSKSQVTFIWIPSPSNRTDQQIKDTSFTLEEAYALVKRLNQGET